MLRRKMGFWIQHTYIDYEDNFECSSCGCHADKPYVNCPQCGIAMKGIRYDPSWVDQVEEEDTMFEDW